MRRIYISLLTSLFSVLMLAAVFSVKPMCMGFSYQPELPKTLRN